MPVRAEKTDKLKAYRNSSLNFDKLMDLDDALGSENV
jgi:hypothetical protein